MGLGVCLSLLALGGPQYTPPGDCAAEEYAAGYPDCPGFGCIGTALMRHLTIQQAARSINLNAGWAEVREDLVVACGLKPIDMTSHCFDDDLHVDCCAMLSTMTRNTAENAGIDLGTVGKVGTNSLHDQISAATNPALGDGGSWCTCQLRTPYDVCHRQFGSRTAFKFVWCAPGLAAILDDDARVITYGQPVDLPPNHAEMAQRSWEHLMASAKLGPRSEASVGGWLAACDKVREMEDFPVIRETPYKDSLREEPEILDMDPLLDPELDHIQLPEDEYDGEEVTPPSPPLPPPVPPPYPPLTPLTTPYPPPNHPLTTPSPPPNHPPTTP